MLYLRIADIAYDVTMTMARHLIGDDPRVEHVLATILLETFVAIPLLSMLIALPTILSMASGQTLAPQEPTTRIAVVVFALLAADAAVSATYKIFGARRDR